LKAPQLAAGIFTLHKSEPFPDLLDVIGVAPLPEFAPVDLDFSLFAKEEDGDEACLVIKQVATSEVPDDSEAYVLVFTKEVVEIIDNCDNENDNQQ
jgi:hypothetical protein